METTGQVNNRTVTILSGAALSGAINLGGIRLFGVVMPDTWTTANLTFQVSYDGGTTYNDLYDDSGSEVVGVAAAARVIVMRDPTIFSSATNIKIRSGTTATPVNQAGDRIITLILRSI